MKIMGKVAWLILVVVVSVCVVLCALCCFQNNPVFSSVIIFHILKNENYEVCFWQISLLIKLRLGKIMKGKKGTVLVFFKSVLECHHISYFEKWVLWAMFFSRFLCWWNYDRKKLQQEKKGTMLVYLVLWWNSFCIIYILSVQYSSQFFCCGFCHIWAAAQTIRRKITWSQFTPNLSY